MPPLLLIPARYAATRLPGKPLADIHGKPMIVRVWERAVAANAGPVAVATDTESIADAIRAAGGTAVMTRADHPSGSDRIHEALQILDPQAKHGTVINLQGDMPTLDPAVVARVLSPLSNPAADIATLAAKIREERERADPAVVKVALAAPQMTEDGDWMMENPASAQRALYFSRCPIPHGEGPLYHHIGIYAYRREALERFVALPASPLERREKLEQLRALEAGMRIDVAVVDTVPLGVDTPETLEMARKMLS